MGLPAHLVKYRSLIDLLVGELVREVLDRLYGDNPNLPPRQPGTDRGLAYRRLKASLTHRRLIRAALTEAFRVTAVAIVASVAVLPFAHMLARAPFIAGALVPALGVAALGTD
jgi:hypothetical protein